MYTAAIPLEGTLRIYTANPFGNTLKNNLLNPLATKCFEPDPVWQRYSLETDFSEYSLKKVARRTTLPTGLKIAAPAPQPAVEAAPNLPHFGIDFM